MKEKLSRLLNKEVVEITPLFGDASYRTYSRLKTGDGETFVLMAMPEGKMSISEEITDFKKPLKELPFINIQRYLKAKGLPVPEILHFSEEDRWLILEDLGDRLFHKVIAEASEEDKIDWYKMALDLLIQLQKKTKPNNDCLAFQKTYSTKVLNWEFDHFWEYYFQQPDLGAPPSDEEKKLFEEETRKMTSEIDKLPKGFTHRDFQSRNLMYRNEKLYLLDFQDALQGPKVYDVVCLLRDSYFDLKSNVNALLKYYCAGSGENFVPFKRAFHLQTVQRKLKDAGRFVYINKAKGNAHFLQYISASMNYVKQSLRRLPEYAPLYEMLKKYVKEWR